ncbi:MAG: Tricarboxylate transport protein TctC [Betaproteobacteria bacterium]|nr:Tricarboxylate transport protein TctC [Betaproteobacteria bacterium]
MNREDRLHAAWRSFSFYVIALWCAAPLVTTAQPYPTKAVRFIVPFPAGGAGDLVIRILAQKMSEEWGHPVVLDNRSGASGALGLQIAAKAAPDGHTLVLGTASTHSINPALQPDLPYDPIRDFTPIASLIIIPNILVAHPSVSARSLQDLIALARAKPRQLSYASNGTGTSAHMAGELLKRAAGIQLLHVPYKGAGIAVNDVLGGHVQLLFGAVATSLPHVRAGKLRALGVTSAKRSSAAPDVPTFAESGLPGFEVVQWFGAFAPARAPRPIVGRVNAALNRAMRLPDVQESFARQGLEIRESTPEAFGAYVKAELDKWSKVVREAGIRAE